MKFEIKFNDTGYSNDKFLVERLGAVRVHSGSDEYPPFEVLQVEVADFEALKEMLAVIDRELSVPTNNVYSSANIQFDPPTIYIDLY